MGISSDNAQNKHLQTTQVEVGYGLVPFKNKSQSIELKSGYQLANTKVELLTLETTTGSLVLYHLVLQ